MKYQRLADRAKYCLEKYIETNIQEYLEEEYCITHVFECETLNSYEKICSFAKEKGFRVFDIGCAMGHQSEVFLNEGVDYVGVNEHSLKFWNSDKFEYIQGHYPFKIDAKDTDLAVSVLCLTWNCYLYEQDKTLHEQCSALQRDFKQCLLYIAKDKVDVVKGYFKGYEHLGEKFHYFYN